MAISIGHKTLVFLGFMLLALGLTGCGDSGPSQADVDATLEARVELAKASLVAPTAAPLIVNWQNHEL